MKDVITNDKETMFSFDALNADGVHASVGQITTILKNLVINSFSMGNLPISLFGFLNNQMKE